jgi:hypothetical protein
VLHPVLLIFVVPPLSISFFDPPFLPHYFIKILNGNKETAQVHEIDIARVVRWRVRE